MLRVNNVGLVTPDIAEAEKLQAWLQEQWGQLSTIGTEENWFPCPTFISSVPIQFAMQHRSVPPSIPSCSTVKYAGLIMAAGIE